MSYSYIESKIFVSFKWIVFFCFVRMRAHGGASWCIILYAGNFVLLIVLTSKVCSISCFNLHENYQIPKIFWKPKYLQNLWKYVVYMYYILCRLKYLFQLLFTMKVLSKSYCWWAFVVTSPPLLFHVWKNAWIVL